MPEETDIIDRPSNPGSEPRPLRIAWFSPLAPVRSGISAYTAEVVPLLRQWFVIDIYPEATAHDFVWRAQREPYDLVVYQLGNSRGHDYMWGYLVPYPGLVVLHDARLHHARARLLLSQDRHDDYRRELTFDQPAINIAFAEYAIAGLGGPIYYFWPMLRSVIRAAKMVAVHSETVAQDLRDAYPGAAVEALRMGVPDISAASEAGANVRRALSLPADATVFAAFGKVTPEKRVSAMLQSIATLKREGRDAYLVLVGDTDDYPTLADELDANGVADRVRVTGYVTDEAVADYLAAANACLCLRWPTALETSASWLRCLAAAKATVITDLAHTSEIPSAVALRVDLLDEAASLANAMRRLADDHQLRVALSVAGHAYWAANHTMDAAVTDYRRLLTTAAGRPAPAIGDLPVHFFADHSTTAKAIVREMDVSVDLFE